MGDLVILPRENGFPPVFFFGFLPPFFFDGSLFPAFPRNLLELIVIAGGIYFCDLDRQFDRDGLSRGQDPRSMGGNPWVFPLENLPDAFQ